MFDKIVEVVIGLMLSVYRLTTTVAAGVTSLIFTGTLIVRQTGGVAGTDEVQISHNGTHATISNRNAGGAVLIDIVGGTNAVAFDVGNGSRDLFAVRFINSTDGYAIVNSTGAIGFSSGDPSVNALDTGFNRVAANVAGLLSGDWFQQTPGRSRVTGDVTNATAAMAAITGLSATLIAGRKYTGCMVLKCSESVAAEGIRVDFAGGTATMTSFAAGAGVLTGGTTVIVNEVSSALTTDFDWSTITGETWIRFEITLVCNAAGTFIPQFSQSADLGGTVTVSLGSFMWIEDMPA